MHTTTDFVLHGGDGAFASRQKALFDQLSIAEKQCNKDKMVTKSTANSKMDVDIGTSTNKRPHPYSQKHRSETKRFRGKESIFKRPEGPAPRSFVKSIPDYHKNPHKWTKYSLEDVSNEDMTEHSNAQAAFSFLKELKARKEKERERKSNKMDTEEEPGPSQSEDNVTFKSKKIKPSAKIQFRKTETKVADNSPVIINPDDKPVFRSSKLIMPEYVVGQKQKRLKKERPIVKVNRLKELRLEHLHESDNEEEDEN